VIKKLLDRRVPQLTGLYIVAAWGFLQFVDWAVDQYTLSPTLINLVVTALLLILPMIVILAWRHGAPGADAWTKVDAGVIGLNMIAAGGILFLVFGEQELGAATTVRLLEDDDGNTVERVIPKAAFRRDVLLWDFDNESGDPDLDWLQTGLLLGIGADLAQDLFVTPVDAFDPRVKERLAEAGFDLPYDVPLSLKRQLTEARGVEHFLEGELDRDGDTLVATTRLYETRNAREVAERTYRGTDPLEMVDRMSVDLRRDLGIPEWQIQESVDLPAAELLTDSPEAFRVFSGVRAPLYRNEFAEARAAARAAIEIDSTFASAHGGVAVTSLMIGDQAAARAAIAEALRYDYRLPERSRLSLQMIDRMMFRNDPEGAVQTGRYWTELYPQDTQARQLLAMTYGMQGNTDGQITQYRALLGIDPGDVQSLLAIAGAFRAKEEYDSALVYYGRLGELQPTDVETRLNIAATLTSLVKFDEAREELEQASVAAPGEPDVLNQLARLDMRQGFYEDAARRVERVNSLGRSPLERFAAAGLEESLYYNLGQQSGLREAYHRRIESAAEHLPPVASVQSISQSELLIYAADWGREDYALGQIDSLRASVEEPWSSLVDVAAVRIHLDRGDIESARQSLVGLHTVNEAFGDAPGRTARITWVEGRIAELEDGDCGRALDNYQAARELVPQSSAYRIWLARCLTTLERWDEAQAEVNWVLERRPGSAKLRLDAARLYAAQGRTANAIAELDVALDIWSEADPDFRPAQEARALLEELQAAG
jgi:tetratricopeptide (TPR) repeat protein/TolB-like protein